MLDDLQTSPDSQFFFNLLIKFRKTDDFKFSRIR